MTLRLTLIRHAKSSWDDPTVDDHDRALNARGHAAARAIGVWLHKHEYCPEKVYLSTARRTAQTWAGISRACEQETEIQFTSALYMASPDRMLTILQGIRARSVLMLSHNPGTSILATALVKQAPNHPKFSSYPSAATSIIDFDVDSWADVTLGSGTLIDFVVPKDLVTS